MRVERGNGSVDPPSTPGDPAGRLVADVMTSPVVAIAAEANVWVAMETFGAAGTRHLVVIETDGSCSGILTHHHIAALWPMDPLGLQDHRVGTIIDRDFAAVPPDATVAEAAATMLRHGVDAVAVLDPTGRVLGVLTGGDIVRLVASVNVDAPTSQRIPVD